MHTDDGAFEIPLRYTFENQGGGVFGLGRDGYLDCEEAAGVCGHVLPPRALPPRRHGVNVDDAKALAVVLLAEVDALEAARIDHGRRRDEALVLVDVPQGDIIEGGQRECAWLQGVVAAQHHRALRAGHGAVHSDVAREDGWDVGVEGIRLRQNTRRQILFQ